MIYFMMKHNIQISRRNKDKVSDLDATLKSLQHQSAAEGKSLSEEVAVPEEKKNVPTTKQTDVVCDEEMNDLADSIKKY